MVHNYIEDAITQHQLPASFAHFVSNWYEPIAHDIANRLTDLRKTNQNRTLCVGVQGTQGSGKSTMADFLGLILKNEFKLNVAVLSIDDFYHTRATRLSLAQSVHPLLKTRGVPGTHDVALAENTLVTLANLKEGESAQLPRFTKAVDDRSPNDMWPTIKGPIDVVIFEGWCVGAQPQPEEELSTACNTLEETYDVDFKWRKYVNDQLSNQYKQLFDKLDCLAVITAPSFDVVLKWRSLQEAKLAARVKSDATLKGTHIMNEEQLKHFISHYQRLTTHCLNTLPSKADWVIELDAQHNITQVVHR